MISNIFIFIEYSILKLEAIRNFHWYIYNKFTLKLHENLSSKICKNKVTHLVDALVLDLFDWQSILDVMQVQHLLDTFLVLQYLLDARFLEGRVAGCKQRDITQMAYSAHDVSSEISDYLVKFVHRSIPFFLDVEKRFMFIGNRRVNKYILLTWVC